MARTYRQRRIYDHRQAEVRRAVERAMYELGLEIKPDATEYEVRGLAR